MKTAASAWRVFAKQHDLSEKQIEQFQTYANLLIEWNNKINLTAITDISSVVDYHFSDSLALSKFVDMSTITTLADVGTGAGFPGLPLKIKYPHLNVTLIEVNHKKIKFLEFVVKSLGLKNVTITDLDWRTFLRTTQESIELFVARASLHEDELIRMFKPSCFYNKSQLVYWASTKWECGAKQKPFLQKEEQYHVGQKKRKLAFFGTNS